MERLPRLLTSTPDTRREVRYRGEREREPLLHCASRDKHTAKCRRKEGNGFLRRHNYASFFDGKPAHPYSYKSKQSILSFSNEHLLLLFRSLLPFIAWRDMEDTKRWQIPAFGNWEYYDEMPITQYFESARQAGLIRSSFFGGEDLLSVPVAMPVKSAYLYGDHRRRKVRKGNGVGVEKSYSKEQQQRKQGRVFEAAGATPRRCRASKAVDEDLYKIPPELLYQKPKRKRMLRNLLSGCLGLESIP